MERLSPLSEQFHFLSVHGGHNDFSIFRCDQEKNWRDVLTTFRIVFCPSHNGCTWEDFRNGMKQISTLKYRTQMLGKRALSDSLPEYRIDDMKMNADTTYYEGEPLHGQMSSKTFFAGLDAVIHACMELSQLEKKEVGIPLHCILCDSQTPGMIHFLYLDFSETFVQQYRKELADEILTHLKTKSTFLHPKIRRSAEKIVKLLNSGELVKSDWQALSLLSRGICEELKHDREFFLCQFPPYQSGSEMAARIYHSLSDCGGRLYLQANRLQQAEQAALEYAACYQNYYIHFAYGNASHGINAMLESDNFRLHSGAEGSALHRKNVLALCQEKTLLILSGFTPCSSEDNLWISQLACADIIFAVDTSYFTSVQDFNDYGSAYLIIQEENNEKTDTYL